MGNINNLFLVFFFFQLWYDAYFIVLTYVISASFFIVFKLFTMFCSFFFFWIFCSVFICPSVTVSVCVFICVSVCVSLSVCFCVWIKKGLKNEVTKICRIFSIYFCCVFSIYRLLLPPPSPLPPLVLLQPDSLLAKSLYRISCIFGETDTGENIFWSLKTITFFSVKTNNKIKQIYPTECTFQQLRSKRCDWEMKLKKKKKMIDIQ